MRSMGMVVMVLLVGAGLAWAKAPEWLETGSSDGKRVWYVPEGWTVAKGVDEEVGDILIYNSADGYGEYVVQGFAKSRGETCPGVVEAATKGKKGKASKGVLCAEVKSGEQMIGACAREDKNGYIILLVLRAPPDVYKSLGGIGKLRPLTIKTYGIAHSDG